MATAPRRIVRIDQDKCDGCGACIPQCAEGAIRVIDGKARLVGENLCDGLGACLGTCPKDAITVEERPAEEFDAEAAARNLDRQHPHAQPRPPANGRAHAGQCPGAMLRMLRPHARAPESPAGPSARASRLAQWPVQLALVPVTGPLWAGAEVLLAADCVGFAVPDFHEKLLAPGKALAVACPKLDDVGPYVTKLAAIFEGNDIKSVTVAHMEVPCCGGLVHTVRQAMERSGRQDIPVYDVTVGIDGTVHRPTPA